MLQILERYPFSNRISLRSLWYGLSLFTVGTNSFGGGGTYLPDFGAPKYWIIDSITLVTCLSWSYLAKGPIRALSALAGLIVGYIVSIPFGLVDFSQIMARGLLHSHNTSNWYA